MTWLPELVRGLFFYPYLILDLYSHKIMGFKVYERESGECGASVVHRVVLAEGCIGKQFFLHTDNGNPKKGSTLRAMLEALWIESSRSRPRASDDNAYSEAQFRTCKYTGRAIRTEASKALRQPANGRWPPKFRMKRHKPLI